MKRNPNIDCERATNHSPLCVCVCVPRERRSWFGRGSGKIFPESEECCEQVFLRRAGESLLERRREKQMKFCSPGFIEVKETTAVLTAGFILLRSSNRDLKKRLEQFKGKKVVGWENEQSVHHFWKFDVFYSTVFPYLQNFFEKLSACYSPHLHCGWAT